MQQYTQQEEQMDQKQEQIKQEQRKQCPNCRGLKILMLSGVCDSCEIEMNEQHEPKCCACFKFKNVLTEDGICWDC
jgi:uncharacterized protein (DUF983 family)